MPLTLLIYEVLLLAVIGGGWWLGAFGQALSPEVTDPDPEAGSERLSDTIGFVGGTYGILLGLLLVFAVGHSVDTRRHRATRQSPAGAPFTAVNPYPAANRDALRHDIVCFHAIGCHRRLAGSHGARSHWFGRTRPPT